MPVFALVLRPYLCIALVCIRIGAAENHKGSIMQTLGWRSCSAWGESLSQRVEACDVPHIDLSAYTTAEAVAATATRFRNEIAVGCWVLVWLRQYGAVPPGFGFVWSSQGSVVEEVGFVSTCETMRPSRTVYVICPAHGAMRGRLVRAEAT